VFSFNLNFTLPYFKLLANSFFLTKWQNGGATVPAGAALLQKTRKKRSRAQ
jgi:hypothetical protein